MIDAKIKVAFKELVLTMRQMENRYFHMPPFTEEDFAALLLSVPVTSRTISGDPNDKTKKSYRIFYLFL